MARAVVVTTAEEDRRQATWNALQEIFGGSIHTERNKDGSLPDGVHVIEIHHSGVCMLVIEIKREMGEGGSDTTNQVSISFRKVWVFGEVSLTLNVYFKASQISQYRETRSTISVIVQHFFWRLVVPGYVSWVG
jgi:hypothetical protein